MAERKSIWFVAGGRKSSSRPEPDFHPASAPSRHLSSSPRRILTACDRAGISHKPTLPPTAPAASTSSTLRQTPRTNGTHRVEHSDQVVGRALACLRRQARPSLERSKRPFFRPAHPSRPTVRRMYTPPHLPHLVHGGCKCQPNSSNFPTPSRKPPSAPQQT